MNKVAYMISMIEEAQNLGARIYSMDHCIFNLSGSIGEDNSPFAYLLYR